MSDKRDNGPDTVPNPQWDTAPDKPRDKSRDMSEAAGRSASRDDLGGELGRDLGGELFDPALADRPGDRPAVSSPVQADDQPTTAAQAAPAPGRAARAPVPDQAGVAAAPSGRRSAAASGPSNPRDAQPPWERKLLEDLAFSALRERRTARRWSLFFRFAMLGLLGVIIYFSFIHRGISPAPTGPHTAVVHVRGEISSGSEASAEKINRALRLAFEASDARAVVLRINSPGGSPVQSGLVNEQIRRLRAKHDKPVYAVVEEAAASGAYYIAVSADKIYVDQASLVGSIGVLMNGFGFTGLMEKIGVERRLLTAGENKGLMDPFSPQTRADTAHVQQLLDSIHQQFIAAVRQGRGDRLKDSPQLFSGLVWNGEQAIALGLADEIGSLERVAREVVQAERLVDYTLRENVAERLARRFGAGVGEGAVRALQWMPELR